MRDSFSTARLSHCIVIFDFHTPNRRHTQEHWDTVSHVHSFILSAPRTVSSAIVNTHYKRAVLSWCSEAQGRSTPLAFGILKTP